MSEALETNLPFLAFWVSSLFSLVVQSHSRGLPRECKLLRKSLLLWVIYSIPVSSLDAANTDILQRGWNPGLLEMKRQERGNAVGKHP